MSALSLQVVSLDATPVAQPMTCAFEGGGGTIGRDESNLMALPDKHRRVSRLHATISFPGGMATITNSSSSLPIAVGEQQLDYGESMPIMQGILIEIGPYILKAHVGSLAHAQAPVNAAAPSEPTVMMPRGVGLSMLDPLVLLDPQPSAPPIVAVRHGDPSARGLGVSGQPSPPATAGIGDFWPEQAGNGAVAQNPLSTVPVYQSAIRPAPSPAPVRVDADPFADLLSGIGTPAAPAASPGHLVSAAHLPAPAQALSSDPLAAFSSGNSMLQPAGLGAGRSDVGAGMVGRTETTGGLIPDDFNPFDMPSSASRNAADPLAALVGNGSAATNSVPHASQVATPSIDSLFPAVGSGASDALAFGGPGLARQTDGTLEGLIRSNSASDPLTLFDAPAVPTPHSARPMRDDAMEIGSAFVPPRPIVEDWSVPAAQQRVTASMASVLPLNALETPAPKAAPAAASSPDVLTDAFLRGAGLAPSALPNGLTPEIMTIVGSLLRSATAGAVDMLAARAATKREVQASVTIISVQANNPLKFLPNADAALLQLLGKKMPGFMRADVAMRDAFDDLRAHEVGVIAGTRAALTEVLGKFDPAVLGDKLAKGSVLESLMPSARKAKLWDMYLERYLQIRREAEDDFQSIFGRAFVQAYERETARIKGESPMVGGERG